MDDTDKLVARTVLIAIAMIAITVIGGVALDDWNTRKMADKGFCYAYQWKRCR